jgi:hypothetical protein
LRQFVLLATTAWPGAQLVRVAAKAVRARRFRRRAEPANAKRVQMAATAQSARAEPFRAHEGTTPLAASTNARCARVVRPAVHSEPHQQQCVRIALEARHVRQVRQRHKGARRARITRPQRHRLACCALQGITVRLTGALPLTTACHATPARSAHLGRAFWARLALCTSAAGQAFTRLKCRRLASHARLERLPTHTVRSAMRPALSARRVLSARPTFPRLKTVGQGRMPTK